MKRFRKKKGSSLILVVFITAVVFTVATTMVAVVTNDYKTRVNESKKLQNLYQSDAGLDVAYNIVSKDSQSATMYAYNLIKSKYNNNTLTDGDNLEAEFKKAFLSFLSEDVVKQSINSVQIKQIDETIKNDTSATVDQFADIDNYKFKELSGNDIKDITGGNDLQDGKLEVVDYQKNGNKITLTVEAQFESKNENSSGTEVNGKLKNNRTIKTKYTIEPPEYYDPAVKQQTGSTEEDVYNVEKAITADGNLNINDGAKVNISAKDAKGNDDQADIWIKGDAKAVNEDYDVANDKYAYGIRMNNASLNISGNAYTNGTLGLSNGSSAVINSLYALNAYTGPISKTDFSEDKGGNSLKANNIYTNNDLVMNSSSSMIQSKNYTGISSEKEASEASGSAKEKAKAAKNSSAIIVNTDANKRNGAKITIENAIVPGFAYMNTAGNSFYGTGEAVAVKGNYIAYTEDLSENKSAKKTDYAPKADYDVKQFKPWDLVEYPDSQNAAQDKANNFKLYWNPQSNDIDDGGVDITNLKSFGAAPYNDGNGNLVKGYTLDKDITDSQNTAKSNFGTLVYGMGQTDKTGSDYYKAGESDMLTVAGKNAVIDFDLLGGRLSKYTEDKLMEKVKIDANAGYANYDGYAFLNADSSKELNITKTADGLKVQFTGGEELSLSGSELNAVIITNGNVNISGDVKINGTIIAGGNVNIAAGSNVNIVRDYKVITSIIHYKNATMKLDDGTGIIDKDLNGSSPIKSEPIELTDKIIVQDNNLSLSGGLNDNATNGYFDSSKCIKQGLWKMVNNNGKNNAGTI